MQADYDRELAQFFTDVEHLHEMFKQWLAAPTLPKRMLIIHGVGGVGKSSLLRMFRLHCKSVNVPVALSSGDEQKSALDVLTRWADDLKADGVALPAFGRTLERYRALLTKAENEVAKTAATLAKGATKTIIETAASTVPGVGPLLGPLSGMAAEALTDWLFSRGFKKPDVDLLLDPARKLTEDFLGDLTKIAEKRRIVLMLDTFEQMTALEEWVCQVAQGLPANVLPVIAGRAIPNWSREWPTWMANAQVEELKPMSEEDMRELARRYYAVMRGGEPDPKQVEAIVHFARGLPMVVTSTVQLWVRYGVEDFSAVKPQVVADLVDWLMEGVPKELVPALKAAAVVRWFDEPILRAVMQREDVRDLYEELRRFPFVRPRAEGLAFHDAVREIMDENLRVQDSERHRELHERAAAYFEKRLEKARGKEAERLGLERLYHRVRADEEAGIRLFQEMAEELVRYRLLNRLSALLNDVNTYPLEQENSRLWREYYDARIVHLKGEDAREKYKRLIDLKPSDAKLYAYVMADYGEALRGFKQNELALQFLEKSISLVPIDEKLVLALSALARAYGRLRRYENSRKVIEKMRDHCLKVGDRYGLVFALDSLEVFYTDDGDFRQANQIRKQRIEILDSLQPTPPYLEMFVYGGLGFARSLLSGRYYEIEVELRQALEIAKRLEVTNAIYIARDLGYILGMEGKYSEAESFFDLSLSIAEKLDPYFTKTDQAVADGFQGAVLKRQGFLKEAEEKLLHSLAIKMELNDLLGVPELYFWLGELSEIASALDTSMAESKLAAAILYFTECISQVRTLLKKWNFACNSLAGLVRVKHALGEYAAIPPLLVEAEQLAQQYEYNDHLASLRLTQGHIAWEGVGQVANLSYGFDAALRYYQQALIYALRYNRFLLDEVLSGRPQGTPLRPIVPACLQRGEEGRKMLIALRDWWKTGINDVGTPRPDTISPLPEGIPLLEAERIAREREPGDGSPQRSVVEQIEAALEEIGAG